MKLAHIGIAVKNIQERLNLWQNILGIKLIGIEEIPEQKVRVAVLELGDTHIELLEPTDNESPIFKFLEKKGEGLHHIALQVEDIEAVLEELKNKGIKLIDEKPRKGAMGAKIAFIHPHGTGGVLIELCQH